jgi:hypothetical protein
MISVNDIHKLEDKKKAVRKEIYKKIYEQFCKKIKLSVEMGLKSVVLTVPNFVLGYPTFDQNKAALYLGRQLTNAGFFVKHISPLDIDVSWRRKNKRKEEEEIHSEEHNLPTLINLKKLAAKHKGA